VTWASSSYNAAVPLGPGSTTTIDPVTGHLYVNANALGLYVVGIRVNEYRNGVLIASTTRDFLFRVVNCIVQLQANITPQEQTPGFVSYCDGLTFTFQNESVGGQFYEWDFGVAGTSADVSSAFEPTYTFPADGIYHVTLVVNPGWPCSDTAHMTLNLNNPLHANFTFNDSTCFQNNSINFTSSVASSPGTTYTLAWDFGPNASTATATTPTVNGIHFSTPTGNVVTLIASSGVCADTVAHPVFLYALPVAQFNLPTHYECLGLTQLFTNTSTGADSYHWDFGVGNSLTDVSTLTNPTFTFPAAGTYTVTLTAEIVPGCDNTIQHDFTVYDPLTVAFTHNDSLCITTNSFNFAGTVTGPPSTTYSWNFGSHANPTSATTLNVSNVVFDAAGEFPVILTASFLDCSLSAASSVFVFKEPTIEFGMKHGLQCVPYHAYFVDSSSADTQIFYQWDFGDGGTSTEQNPIHIYTQAGQYTVTLSITTTTGCAETLTLTKPGLVVVHPTPVSDFDVNPKLTDICHAFITFTDQSQGALTFIYVFDDGNAASEEANPHYNYITDGTHNPLQIAINEFGCRDTSRNSLFIEPFTVYIPNTFTPDGDEFNNTFSAVLALDAVEWEMKIYDRWGQLVFTSDDQHGEWDGTYNGLMAPQGVYSYTVRYISCSGGDRWDELTGHVSLLR
jgi:gliding motility-associated-like protein